MKKIFLLLLFLLFNASMIVVAQEREVDIIWLKNGSVFKGKIVWQNDKMLMLNTTDDKRFQFNISDIKEIGSEITIQKEKELREKVHNPISLSALLEVNGGLVTTSGTTLQHLPNFSISASLGTKTAFGSDTFLGLGVGYDVIYATNMDSGQSFLPLFVNVYQRFGKGRVKPFVNSNVGYQFALGKGDYKGGMLLHCAGGVSYSVSDKLALIAGLKTKIMLINGEITEKNELGNYNYNGNAYLSTIGITFAVLF